MPGWVWNRSGNGSVLGLLGELEVELELVGAAGEVDLLQTDLLERDRSVEGR